MVKMKVNIINAKKTLRLILILGAFLSILNGVSYQDVWADSQQESTKELAQVPALAEAIRVNAQSMGGASMVIMPKVTSGKVIPVNMARFFFVLIIGMAGIKLVLVMAEKVGLKQD